MTRIGSQRAVDLLVLLATASAGASAYLAWVRADPGPARPRVSLTGYDVSRTPSTAVLVALVALVVVRLSGTALRRVLCALVAVQGIVVCGVALAVRPDAEELSTTRPALSQVVTDRVDVTVGPAPWFALAAGVMLVAAGLLGSVTANRWRRPSGRYQRAPAAAGPAAGRGRRNPADGRQGRQQDQWKAIDAGEDPTI